MGQFKVLWPDESWNAICMKLNEAAELHRDTANSSGSRKKTVSAVSVGSAAPQAKILPAHIIFELEVVKWDLLVLQPLQRQRICSPIGGLKF